MSHQQNSKLDKLKKSLIFLLSTLSTETKIIIVREAEYYMVKYYCIFNS